MACSLAPLLLMAGLSWPAAQQPASSPSLHDKDLVSVQLRSPGEAWTLRQHAEDFLDHLPISPEGEAWILADPREQERLAALGFQLTVVQEDLSAFYAQRAMQDQVPRGVGGSMGGFKTLAEIAAAMDDLQAAYPFLVSPKWSLGQSHEGRPLLAMRLSDNPTVDEPEEAGVWFDALHHAREPMGAESILLFAEWLCANYGQNPTVTRLLDTRDFIFVPCANPDGYEYNRQTRPNGGGLWRKNRRNNGGSFGVDLNRNYGWEWGSQWNGSSGNPNADDYRGPSAFSEPETQAIRDALALHPPGTSVSAHTFSNLWIYSWGYDRVLTAENGIFRWYGEQMTAHNHWPYGAAWEVLYEANGVSADWHYGTHGTFAFSPEIGSFWDGFWPRPSKIPSLFWAVQPSYLLLSQWSGGWLEAPQLQWQEVSGNGNAVKEVGETWQLWLQFGNSGVRDLNVALQLQSRRPEIQVLIQNAQGWVPAHDFALLGPFELHLQSSLGGGQVYALDLDLDYDGAQSHLEIPLLVGKDRLLFHDAMENGDFGWTVQNAAGGSFELGIPELTMESGRVVQPGEDNPNGQGQWCWVTGAAAGNQAGDGDVDGLTVLTSPLFSCAGFQQAEIQVARWFANDPSGPQDDVLVAEVSADGGQNWVRMNAQSHDPQWREVRYDLENFVALTDQMRLRWQVADQPDNDLCEALLDDLRLSTASELPTLGLWGAATLGNSVLLFLDGPPQVPYRLLFSFDAGEGQTVTGIQGLLYLENNVSTLWQGNTDALGQATVQSMIPNQSSLLGRTLHLQSLFDEAGSQAAYSSLLSVLVQ
ncbi:MAG: hypothetical protein DWQ01_22085 [Planctomycetota bacterium]|nr:MAG: hypothetical protein DWQ01_22085 [Planctomycetota bacterium]